AKSGELRRSCASVVVGGASTFCGVLVEAPWSSWLFAAAPAGEPIRTESRSCDQPWKGERRDQDPALHLPEPAAVLHRPLRQDRPAVCAAEHRPADGGAAADGQLHHHAEAPRLRQHDQPDPPDAEQEHHQPDPAVRLRRPAGPPRPPPGRQPPHHPGRLPLPGPGQPASPDPGQQPAAQHSGGSLPGLPGDPGGPGPELQQPGGRPLGDGGPAGERQHAQPGPQPHRERPRGHLLQPAQASQAGHDLQQAEEDPSGSALPAHPRLRQDEGLAAQRAGAQLRREPAALQLRAGVAAAADQGGRPGDVRVPQEPGREVLLDHPGGGWRQEAACDLLRLTFSRLRVCVCVCVCACVQEECCVRAPHDHPTHLQDVCDGGSGGQPALPLGGRPRALHPLGQPRRQTAGQHVQNRLLPERVAGHPEGLGQAGGGAGPVGHPHVHQVQRQRRAGALRAAEGQRVGADVQLGHRPLAAAEPRPRRAHVPDPVQQLSRRRPDLPDDSGQSQVLPAERPGVGARLRAVRPGRVRRRRDGADGHAPGGLRLLQHRGRIRALPLHPRPGEPRPRPRAAGGDGAPLPAVPGRDHDHHHRRDHRGLRPRLHLHPPDEVQAAQQPLQAEGSAHHANVCSQTNGGGGGGALPSAAAQGGGGVKNSQASSSTEGVGGASLRGTTVVDLNPAHNDDSISQ
ncbi:unnamed protein product, partial [Tetraodon nigroviridis]